MEEEALTRVEKVDAMEVMTVMIDGARGEDEFDCIDGLARPQPLHHPLQI